MKKRTGFVSNSSSSSFIVAFPKGFEPTRGRIIDYLFSQLDVITNPYHDEERGLTVSDAARYILGQMKDQSPNDQAKINEALSGWLPGQPDFPSHSPTTPLEERVRIGDAWVKNCEAYAKRWWRENQKKLKPAESDLYVFWFGDGNGASEAALEYGPTFDAAPALKISHH
jgi:hypothetical protein